MNKTIDRLSMPLLIIFLTFALAPLGAKAALRGNTNNATLSLSPNSGTYRTGGNFLVDILVNTHGQNVNAVSAYINYNPALFTVTIDTTGSIFGTEAESTVAGGAIKITRGVTAPTVINTLSGKVATLNITALANTAPSADNFTFDFVAGDANQSNVFLADQTGTPVLSGVDEGRYAVDGTPPANVTSFAATGGYQQVSLSWTNPGSDFGGVKILRKTGSYPANPTDGTSVYDSNGTSYVDTGLLNGTTYYYAAFAHDAVLNYASGAQASAAPRDNIPPAAISTLAAAALTARSVQLNWTAVGEDGTVGMAASYDVRYSTSAITAANFSSATQASGAPTPKVSGSAETMTVSGLSGNTTYYFAVKAADSSGNSSTVSNVVSTKTYKTADLNNNGIVNAQDFSILLSFWGNTSKPPADINQDNFVNAQDFSIMLSMWG